MNSTVIQYKTFVSLRWDSFKRNRVNMLDYPRIVRKGDTRKDYFTL